MGFGLIHRGYQAARHRILGSSPSVLYPGPMTCRTTNVGVLLRSASPHSAFSSPVLSSVVGALGRKALRSLDLTRLFQGTKTRALRGFCPLNSNR